MIHARELHTDHANISFEHPTLTKLRANNRNPSIEKLWTVLDSQTDTQNGYLVAKVEFLTKPLDQADVVEDSTHTYLCGCDGFYFHYAKDTIEPSGYCKHCDSVRIQEREIKPDGQATL